MKCQFCDQEATVTYTKVVGDKSQKSYLCNDCADEQGVTNLDNFNLSDILMNDKSDMLSGEESLVNEDECKQCGFTLNDLRKIGRLGCSVCYESFRDEISGMINTMHKGVEHKGKVPEGMIMVIEAKSKLAKLEAELKQFVDSEDYEKAGEIKQEILAFKETLAGEVK